MKKLFLVIMLAMSISYGKPSDDAERMNSYLTQCGNKDIVRWIALFANLNKKQNITEESIEIFMQYMEQYCNVEVKNIIRIGNKYPSQTATAIFAFAVGLQFEIIANYMLEASKTIKSNVISNLRNGY